MIAELRKRLDDAPTETAVSLLTPYMAYLPAEALGISAVLAAVSAGLYLGWRSPELVTPSTRIQITGFWEILTFALNAVLFVLIGLQLRTVIDGLGEYSTGELAGYAAAIAATVIVTRMACSCSPSTFLSRLLVKKLPRRDRRAAAGLPADRAAGLVGHARARLAGRRAGDPAADRRRRAVPRPRPHHLPGLRGDPRHRGRAGADAAAS